MGERIGRRDFILLAVATAAEACGPRETPQQQVARGFVSALAVGDSSRALSFVAPDARLEQAAKQQVASLVSQVKGCGIDEIVIRKNPIGSLVCERATVTFKTPCGRSEGLLAGAQFSGLVAGLEQINHRYYVDVLTATPVSTEGQVKPVLPTPARAEADRLKEKVLTSPLRLYPTGLIEDKEGAGEGRKFLIIQFVLENPTREWVQIPKTPAKLITSDGAEYSLRSSLGDMLPDELPPGFRMESTIWRPPDPGSSGGGPTATGLYGGRVNVNSAPRILKIEGFSEFDLTRGFASEGSFRFPTDRPDSEFRQFGKTVDMPAKGRVTVDIAGRGSYRGLFVEIENTAGRQQQFSIRYAGVFVNNGIFDSPGPAGKEHKLTLAPGQKEELRIAFSVGWAAEHPGKLILRGDMKEIFNYRPA